MPRGRLAGMTISRRALLGERIARHGLAGRPAGSVAAAAALTGALQAQDVAAARLGVRARSGTVTEHDVRCALQERSVVRSWLLRGTIHLVASTEYRWLMALLGPQVRRKYRSRWRQIGLSDAVLERSLEVLPAVLAGGTRSRAEIMRGLGEHGLTIDSPDPQAGAHLIVHASACGLVCHATERGRDATFALVDDWLPQGPAGPRGDEALAELARRFFSAYSPATAADFAAWSGLPSGRAVALIRGELAAVDVDGRPGFRLGEVEPARGVRLLPAFDNYLLGYRHRDAFIDADRRPHVYVGGMIRPTVLVDGSVTGTWSLRRGGDALHATIRPFAPFNRSTSQSVEQELADLGRFYDRPVRLAGIDPW